MPIKEIVFKVIYDNCKENKDLQEGWGFSTLIEAGTHKILFDTGNDLEAFLSNSEKMGIDYQSITDVVFSHKHKDHIAGCREILEKLRKDVRVFLPKGFPTKKVPQNIQIQKVNEFTQIGENIFSIVLRGGFFLKEQSLILQMEKGLVVVTGCAHPGIVRILQTVQQHLTQPIYFVLGGFHLFRNKGDAVKNVVSTFQSLKVKQVAPCHCSGASALYE